MTACLSGHGWGYGVGVSVTPDVVSAPGRYGWSGGYGTAWFNDPNRGLVAIAMTQVSVTIGRLRWRGSTGVRFSSGDAGRAVHALAEIGELIESGRSRAGGEGPAHDPIRFTAADHFARIRRSGLRGLRRRSAGGHHAAQRERSRSV